MINLQGVVIPLALVSAITLCTYWLGQKLHRDFLIASIRMILQLILLSYILNWLFQQQHFFVGIIAVAVMTINAAFNIKSRVKHSFPGLFLDNFVSLAVTLWPLSFLGSYALYQHEMSKISLFLPLLGMLLGNTLNNLSQGLDFFTRDLKEKKDDVLSLIALGATTSEATKSLFNHSLRVGMSSTINSMISMGIISIPGLMTGQLMAGTSPSVAVVMQIAMMLLILAGSYLGLSLSLFLARRRFFNSRGEICF